MSTEPIFKAIFDESWESLPTVFRKHYANRISSDDRVVVEGSLDLLCRAHMKVLSPLLWLMGGAPPSNGKNVRVTVQFTSSKEGAGFNFDRIFNFENRKPHYFRSKMLQVKGNEVVEIMRFGICWRMHYLWQDNKVILRHKGYAWHLFNCFIPLPISWLVGRSDAEEVAVSDDEFDMSARITHPLFGRVYEYSGRFKVVKVA